MRNFSRDCGISTLKEFWGCDWKGPRPFISSVAASVRSDSGGVADSTPNFQCPTCVSFCLSGCLSAVSLTFPYVDYIRDHNEETTHAHQMTLR